MKLVDPYVTYRIQSTFPCLKGEVSFQDSSILDTWDTNPWIKGELEEITLLPVWLPFRADHSSSLFLGFLWDATHNMFAHQLNSDSIAFVCYDVPNFLSGYSIKFIFHVYKKPKLVSLTPISSLMIFIVNTQIIWCALFMVKPCCRSKLQHFLTRLFNSLAYIPRFVIL